jgi:hypothetical protein
VEYIPLALAVLVLLKVEASLYDGDTDMEFYRRKLAEHRDRTACRQCMGEADEVFGEAQGDREKSAEADGELRGD